MLMIVAFSSGDLLAEKGFSIRGGLYFDAVSQEVFDEIETRVGFQGKFGLNPYDRLGRELGVITSNHTYRLGTTGQFRDEDVAEKTAVFLKFRGVPYRYQKVEIVLGAGPAYYSISGNKRYYEQVFSQIPEEYSGIGMTSSLDVRYYITDNLAVSGFIIGNIVKYTKKSQFSIHVENPSNLSRGDSIGWGLNMFYWIGMP
jgi:hypothetical protein